MVNDIHIIVDVDKEMECNFGEWYDYDGHITINCALIDSPEEFMTTVIHEVFHDLIDWGVYPYTTTEKQDHWVIPRMLC